MSPYPISFFAAAALGAADLGTGLFRTGVDDTAGAAATAFAGVTGFFDTGAPTIFFAAIRLPTFLAEKHHGTREHPAAVVGRRKD
jgi:hypothetical protein